MASGTTYISESDSIPFSTTLEVTASSVAASSNTEDLPGHVLVLESSKIEQLEQAAVQPRTDIDASASTTTQSSPTAPGSTKRSFSSLSKAARRSLV
jgi:hypothetical protein